GAGGARAEARSRGTRTEPDTLRVSVAPDAQSVRGAGQATGGEVQGERESVEPAALAGEGARPLRRAPGDHARHLDEKELARGSGRRRDEPRDPPPVGGRGLRRGGRAAPADVHLCVAHWRAGS